MCEEIKFDHFKDINELLENIDIWFKEDDVDYTRWFNLNDLHNLKKYITTLENKINNIIKKCKDKQYETNDEWLKKFAKEIQNNLESKGEIIKYE